MQKKNTTEKKSHITINPFGLFGIYIISFAIALLISDKIAVLPFSNPWRVTGILTQKEYNPANNIIKFITIITLPSLVLATSFFLLKSKKELSTQEKKLAKANSEGFSIGSTMGKKKLFFLSIIIISVVALNIPTYHSNRKSVDSFHEGESLGTAISYLANKVPYKETIFVHGIFQDPLRSVIAFNLFGKSIGSVRTLESIVKILSFILLFILLLKLFRQNYLYAYITFLILMFGSILISFNYFRDFPELLLILPRDVTTFLFIILFLSLRQIVINDRTFSIVKFALIVFLFSFVPLASFSYSIDRGYYLTATFLTISPVMLFFSAKKGFAKYFLLSSSLGLVSAAVLLFYLLNWDFSAFFEFVFLIMPKYKELMDGKEYQFYNIKFLFPVAIIALNTYWVTYHLLKEVFKGDNILSSLLQYFKAYVIEICLLVMSIFFFRSALGRSDLEHVQYSSVLSYVLLTYIFIKYYLHVFLQENKRWEKVLIIFTIISVSLLTTAGFYRIYKHDLLEKNFPYNIDDSHFIPDQYKNTITFIKSSLGEKDTFFTMTSEAIWYYYINKPCPSKFPVVWFAMPYFYQEQTIRDLKDNNVKIILYKNNNWSNTIDGFTSQERLPIIDSYIKEFYSFFKIIDGNELWIRNHQ
jgi:hypothetical protein